MQTSKGISRKYANKFNNADDQYKVMFFTKSTKIKNWIKKCYNKNNKYTQ